MKSFQTILLIIFGFLILGAVLVFSGLLGFSTEENNGAVASDPVTLWGVIDSSKMEEIIRQSVSGGEDLKITYVEKREKDFEADLVDALASGSGPDLILAQHTLILKQKGKFLAIPEASFSERLFRDSFIEAGEIFLNSDSVLALPFYVDPLVMYWNRDILTQSGFSLPPSSWLELQLEAGRLTKKDGAGNITVSAVALGGVDNINYLKEILSAQIMQTGNSIVAWTGQKAQVELDGSGDADSALRYYTEFSNPSLSKYSWNRGKKNSLDEFVAGRLGVYFGLASDLPDIKERNGHLNFDAAVIPQITDSKTRATFANVYAFGVMKTSGVKNSAFATVYKLSLGEGASVTAAALGLPPARRDLLAVNPGDAASDTFYKSAVISKTWYDSDWRATGSIFSDMVNSVIIGRSDPSVAVGEADSRLRDLSSVLE